MANHLSSMPLWSILLFVASFLFSLSFIAKPIKQARLRFGIYAFYTVYLLYISVLALKGVFEVDSLPPKVMIWGGIPLLIILFGFIGNTGSFKTVLRSISLESLIAIHVFRVLGIFFILLYYYHLLPGTFAFFAGLGDFITAILALPVARVVARKYSWWMVAVVVWNIFGIMDIVDLLTIAVTTGVNGNLREMTVFPFVWFPAFAPATILFLHTVVFRKMAQLKKENKIEQQVYGTGQLIPSKNPN